MIFLLLGAAINGVIVGLIVMLAGKVVLKEAPEFVDAFKACFYAALAGAIAQFVFGLMLDPDAVWTALLISMALSYVIYVIMFQLHLGYTMGQAAAVAAVATLVLFGLVIGLTVLISMLIVL